MRIPLNHGAIAEFCRRWSIVELDLFGSVLREDFHSDSDVDVLFTLAPGVRRPLADLLCMESELEALFGRRVDLTERRLVEESENYLRRAHILRHLEPVYVA